MPEIDRRNFLKLVGIGAGGAAASGCADHVEKLIPYVVQPEVITPGLPVVYASTCLECPAACGLHVRTRESRPIKLEGNPDHPINRGSLCGRGQASIGRTYHPDRFRKPQRRGASGALEDTTWAEATAALAAKLTAQASGVWVLGGASGPALSGLINRFVAAVGAGGRLVYEPFSHDGLREASRAVFGVAGLPVFDLTGADYVLDLGADSFESWLSPVEHQRQVLDARDVASEEGRSARMVYVGPRLSMTASSSDEWLPARAGSEGLVALALARVVFDRRQAAGLPVGGDPALLAGLLADFTPEKVAAATGVDAAALRRVGEQMAEAKRPVALPPGAGLASARAVATNAAVLVLDAVLGAVGRNLGLPADTPTVPEPARLAEIEELVGAMNAGRVSVLLIHDANPVYSLPPELGFEQALAKVGLVVSFASIPDETSEKAQLVLPDHTPLESWGDASPRPGVRSVVQPTIRPLYDTQALGDTLLEAARAMGEATATKLPQGSFRSVVEAGFSGSDLATVLAKGGVFAAAPLRQGPVQAAAAKLRFGAPELSGDGDHALLAHPSPLLYDGRGATLPWLQETPDPVTKISWQSWLEMSDATAEALGVETGDVVSVETAAGTALVPAFARGGIRDDVVALAVGQGHRVGLYASHASEGRPGEARGASAAALVPATRDEAGGRAWFATKARLTATGAHARLALTQKSDNKRGRQLGDAVPLSALVAKGHGEGDAHGGSHELRRPFDAAEDAVDDSLYRWGMTIDVDKCTGCSACVVACSIENNIPNVGEEGVARSRQMHWLRIERYLGDGDQELRVGRPPRQDREQLGRIDVRNSPMLCQQCGAAPCEPVCPVIATYHSPEGLNGMIYNRCIGTRYCSNNCPYKVRRFNYFDYAIERLPEPLPLMLNPDVTVRSQGVMEKCTFCVQRIDLAGQGAKDAGRPIADGEVTPACAQTCPSQAIVFGNLRDEKSRAIAQSRGNPARSYHALHVLNTRPSVTYLARVTRDPGSRIEEGSHHAAAAARDGKERA
jgi:anaerobic selenocysteine-containing dehydrogenase/Fe-S-cluster-containing dehydrogenase component